MITWSEFLTQDRFRFVVNRSHIEAGINDECTANALAIAFEDAVNVGDWDVEFHCDYADLCPETDLKYYYFKHILFN